MTSFDAATVLADSCITSQPLAKARGLFGLSIVKRLCELLDASLELETSPGKGSTFRVMLPRQYDPGGKQ